MKWVQRWASSLVLVDGLEARCTGGDKRQWVIPGVGWSVVFSSWLFVVHERCR
jgi:hypothetical protein